MDLNLRECFRALAGRRERAENRNIGGVEIVSLGVRFQMFNAAFLASPVADEADLQRRIAAASVHFQARGSDWALWLCDGLLPGPVNQRAPRILSRQGLRLATQMPGMVAPNLDPPVRALPDCVVRAVESDAVLADFCEIGSQCFRVQRDWFNEVFDGATRQREPFRGWVGYAGPKPVATAATVRGSGVLGVYNVATLPQFRKIGYAEALMRQCLAREATENGTVPLVLQSTASGLSLYERMGFEAVTRFRVWVS